MRKLSIWILLAIVVSSCSNEPIGTMRTINPSEGFNETGKKIMIVEFTPQGGANVHKPFEPETISIKFNPSNNKLLIDNQECRVIESTDYTITYEQYDMVYVIEFNAGYIYQDGKTKTKFKVYQYGNKKKEYIVYTYNN